MSKTMCRRLIRWITTLAVKNAKFDVVEFDERRLDGRCVSSMNGSTSIVSVKKQMCVILILTSVVDAVGLFELAFVPLTHIS